MIFCLDQLPGMPQPMSALSQNMFAGGSAQLGSLPLMPAQFMTQQATRHARRVYVGGLPPSANEQTIATFFSQVMTAIGGNAAGPGDAVVNVYINHEKKFAFVEMRSVEEASNAMALDGISFEGVSVRVKRPTDYNPALAAALGPSLPSPHLNLAAVGLVPGAVAGTEGPDRIFVGGIPYYFNEDQMRELLQSFGPLKAFDLVKDRDTGNSKGYGFCVYQDSAVTDIACDALNGLKMGDKTLTVRRAAVSTGQAKLEHENLLAHAQQHVAMQKMAIEASGFNLLGVTLPNMGTTESPTKILCLNQVVTVDELRDDNEYEEILEDMRDECGKFGDLTNIVIPRPDMEGKLIPGVGKVFLEYADTSACASAKNMLGGRKFGGNTVTADYYPEDKFYGADYSG
ncbi:splicing factor U2af large subunit B isoform X3 [Spinacia oleracea]|uniref:Splicing factor U2af large subunit n=1 Tax=Spinacia oleracea TaxID=3562 RepID=A0ABM3QT99_SPIOL|nr:splicing factor U2af large subunit B-like isoform X3 [Spinacia oleracea]